MTMQSVMRQTVTRQTATRDTPHRQDGAQDLAQELAQDAGRHAAYARAAHLVAPRLRLAHGLSRLAVAPSPRDLDALLFAETDAAAEPAVVAIVADSLARDGAARLDRAIAERMAAGARPLDLVETLLAPAARRCGALWEDDALSFEEVTVAVGRMAAAFRRVAEGAAPKVAGRARRLLLATSPGETHDFGLSVVAAACRADGGDVTLRVGARLERLGEEARAQAFDLVGVSLSCGDGAEGTARLVARLRAADRARRKLTEPPLGFMVGGRAFLENPDLTRAVGADAMATDARAAPERFNDLLDVLRLLR